MRSLLRYGLALVFPALIGPVAAAEEAHSSLPSGLVQNGETADLGAFLWRNRPVVVFADSPADPRFEQQLALLLAETDALIERDIVVLTDTDPTLQSDLRTKLRPRGFMVVLVGKDGGVKLRKPIPWNVRELSRVIDKMPMRQQEIEDRRSGRSGE